jgi:DNA-binding response OmpR family regulator
MVARPIYYAILSWSRWFLWANLLSRVTPFQDPGSMSSKILLLVKKFPEEIRVSSVAAGDAAFQWRSFSNPPEVAAALRQEDFGLLFFDHRGVPGDPLGFIESVRDPQKKTPVFLLSDSLEMVSVIHAIRLGVKDYFQPPWDQKVIIERLQTALKANALNPSAVQIEKWSEFVSFLSNASVGDAGGLAKAETKKATGTTEVASSSSLKAERDSLIAERQQLEEERLLLKQAQ